VIVKRYVALGLGISVIPAFCPLPSDRPRLASCSVRRLFGQETYGIVTKRGYPSRHRQGPAERAGFPASRARLALPQRGKSATGGSIAFTIRISSTIILEMRTIGESLGVGAPAAVLFGKTRRRLLGWLFTHPDESFYVRELVRFTGAAQGAISGDLEKLAAAGILRRDTRGNQVFYQADAKSPIFGELKSIFVKTAGLADELRRALKPLGSHDPPGNQKPVRRRRPRPRRGASGHRKPETERIPAPDGAFLWASES